MTISLREDTTLRAWYFPTTLVAEDIAVQADLCGTSPRSRRALSRRQIPGHSRSWGAGLIRPLHTEGGDSTARGHVN